MAVTLKPICIRRRVGPLRHVLWMVAALAAIFASTHAHGAEPVDSQLPKYNVTWTSPSAAISDSLPIGNGLIAALVWAQSNGDLMISVATGDSWDENARTIRLGNIRVALSPNPFAAGQPFTQVLKYKEGEIAFSAGSIPAIALRVWVDANNPVIHVEASASSAFGIQVTPELWRTTLQDVSNNTPWKDFIHVAKDVSSATSLLKVVLTPDVMVTAPGKIGWYHRNEISHWAETMTNQSIDVAAFGVKDPLTYRTSGALIQGTGLVPSGNKLVSSQAQSSFRVDIAAHTDLAPQVATWQSEIDAIGTTVFAANIETLRAAHQQYWGALWNRSYVFVTGNTDADNVTKGWLAARYLMACQGRAESPIEFNGGLFTFQNDMILWHDYTQANQQFAHWGMLPSGDFDLIQPWFDMNVAAIPVARAKAKVMWNHDGVMLPEHMILYGPQSGSHYGWDRTGKTPATLFDASTRLLYGGTMENAVLMLDYYEYTNDAAFATAKLIPFAGQVVKWHDLHWSRVNGKINMFPIYSGEKDKNVTNSMVDVAGLTKLVNGLLALPASITTATDRSYWTSILSQIPSIPMSGGRFAPAQDLAVGADTNNQNLAPIFPYRLYGPGKPNLQTAVDSYNGRTGQAPRDGRQAWRHDACHASYLGLAAEAKTQTVTAFTNYRFRYEGFVNGSPDADACIEPIAIGKIALQAMVMHPGAGTTINVLNAWPAGWDVQFKLWAPQKTWVSGQTSGGRVTALTVSPASRVADILVSGVAPAGVAITGSNDPGGFVAGGSVGIGGSGGAAAPDAGSPDAGPHDAGIVTAAGSGGDAGGPEADAAIGSGGAGGGAGAGSSGGPSGSSSGGASGGARGDGDSGGASASGVGRSFGAGGGPPGSTPGRGGCACHASGAASRGETSQSGALVAIALAAALVRRARRNSGAGSSPGV